MVMIDQVPNIESSSSYMFTAKASTSGAVNAEFSTSNAVNVQPNSSYMIDTKTKLSAKMRKKKEINQKNVIFANLDASKAQQDQKAPLIPQPFTLKHFINQKKHLLIQNEEPKDSDDSENSEKENNSAIENLAITKYRSRPVTKRFKAATEKPCH
ncbi:19572_t:CDS:2 [Gigaspora margarita]|uniref:19572_t:CDS:1 n=1 Tax=Gigaspora margarita TaxID=4874 RepID=A0ABN7UHI5_GIGMA|nr:19572_t:CDS:2 [Gigaspora margarita]